MEDFVQTEIQAKTLFDDGHKDINRDGNPNLSLHSVLGCAVESFNSEMLLNPSEEQLDAPTSAIQLGNGKSWESKLVGEEDQPQIFLGIEVMNATQRIRIKGRGFGAGEQDGLVGPQACGFVDGIGLATVKLDILPRPGDKESRGSGKQVKPPEVQIATIEDVECAWFEQKLVEAIDMVDLPSRHVNMGGNVAPKIQQGVYLAAEIAPRETGSSTNR